MYMLDYNKLMINDLLKQSGRVPHSVDGTNPNIF